MAKASESAFLSTHMASCFYAQQNINRHKDMLRSMPRACFILLGLRIDSAFSLLVFCPIRALVSGEVRLVSAFSFIATRVVYKLRTCCLVFISMLR